MLSLGIAFILSSVFITSRRPEVFEEMQLSSAISTMFISFIIIGVLSITSVLPVMLSIRDMFYRHRAAGMLGHSSLAMALGVAEKRFILSSSMLFTIVFYFTMGLDLSARKFFAFWGFFTFNLAIYSYFGQAFMCLVRGLATAQILCSVFIGINNFFSGLIVRPQYLTGFWQITYWITPGHYVFEGMVVTQFSDDQRLVEAYVGSEFFDYMNCTLLLNTSHDGSKACVGYVSQYVDSFFGGRFSREHVPQNLLILGLYLFAARVLTYFALKKFNYASS
jgi:ABC-type multidrug transport system permease subunit